MVKEKTVDRSKEAALRRLLAERLGEEAGAAAAKMLRYRDLLLERNRMVNITSIEDPEEFVEKHLLDSLAVLGDVALEDATDVLDLGTGGGFPGIPLAICFPEKRFVLLDSLAKRLKILEELAKELGIENVRMVHGRAEDLAHAKTYRERFDLCLSRAVAPLSPLTEYCLPFVKVGGCFIAYKGPEAEEEAREAEEAILALGGALSDLSPSSLCLEDGQDLLEDLRHMLVYIEKEEKTPKNYPRKAGTPTKRPL